MTLGEWLAAAHDWADFHANELLLAALLVPVLGTIAARIGKGGRSDADGRFIASVVLSVAFALAAIEAIAIAVGWGALGRSLLDVNVKLLAAPILCLAGSLLGLRLVFPLSRIAAFRTAVDFAMLLAAIAAIVWLFSKFRGWGVLFFGHVTELVVLAIVGFFLLRRLVRRVFGSERRDVAATE